MSLNPKVLYSFRQGRSDWRHWRCRNNGYWIMWRCGRPSQRPNRTKDAEKNLLQPMRPNWKYSLGIYLNRMTGWVLQKCLKAKQGNCMSNIRLLWKRWSNWYQIFPELQKYQQRNLQTLWDKRLPIFKSAYNAFKSGKTSYEDFLKDNEIEIQSPQPQGEMVEKTALGRAYRGTKSEALALKLEKWVYTAKWGALRKVKAGRSIYEELGVLGR